MMYPYMTLNDDTEITHSEMKSDGRVKVYIETPDLKDGFHSAVCWLPEYSWECHGYSDAEMSYFKNLIRNNAHLIMEIFRKWLLHTAAATFYLYQFVGVHVPIDESAFHSDNSLQPKHLISVSFHPEHSSML